jgi:putative metallohydrolase (TIGR04338 family)
MSSKPTDQYRQAVYRAEDQWSAILDRGGRVDFFGSQLIAPIQMRFGGLNDVLSYVGHVCRNCNMEPPGVRHRKGGTRAHYEIEEGVIAIPSDHVWAMRESVVLHEIAHHLCVTENSSVLHDRHFTNTMLTLVREQLGHEAELLLRTGYQAAGAPV